MRNVNWGKWTTKSECRWIDGVFFFSYIQLGVEKRQSRQMRFHFPHRCIDKEQFFLVREFIYMNFLNDIYIIHFIDYTICLFPLLFAMPVGRLKIHCSYAASSIFVLHSPRLSEIIIIIRRSRTSGIELRSQINSHVTAIRRITFVKWFSTRYSWHVCATVDDDGSDSPSMFWFNCFPITSFRSNYSYYRL